MAFGRATYEYASRYVNGSSTCFHFHNSCITEGRLENEIVGVGINQVRRHVKVWFKCMHMTLELTCKGIWQNNVESSLCVLTYFTPRSVTPIAQAAAFGRHSIPVDKYDARSCYL